MTASHSLPPTSSAPGICWPTRVRRHLRSFPQGLVQQCRGGDEQWRLRGGVRPGKCRSPQFWPCWLQALRRFIPAMFRHAICAGRRSARDRSSSSNTKSNQGIKVSRNPNYWKSGRPYLDGIEYTIIPNRSTAILAFVAGNFDMIFPYELTVPLVTDVKSQVPTAICDISPMNVAANILMNPSAAVR